MASKWFTIPVQKPQATIRLFCFPYAGGIATLYRSWAALLPPHVEMVAIELPGHGSRMAEPLFTHVAQIVDDLTQPMLPLLDRPAAFFGFSMGSLISYELAQHLHQDHGITLAQLFVAAHRAPHILKQEEQTHTMAPEAFRQKLITLNGTPQEVLDNVELYNLVEPILRADFQICNTYPRRLQLPLTCPVAAFGAIHDPSVSRQELEAWQQTTTGSFSLSMLPGDHFFISSQRERLIDSVGQTLLQRQEQL